MSTRTNKPRGRKDGRRRQRLPKAVGAKRSAVGLQTDTPVKPDFAPSPTQLKYLFALRTAATNGDNTSDAEMQRLTKISRMTMWEWKREPAFRGWLQAAMRTEHDHDFELAVTRHSRLAIQGSVRSFEALARLRSIAIRVGPDPMTEPAAPTAYAINILVPRPAGHL